MAFQHFQPVLCEFHMRRGQPCHVRLHTLFYSIKTSDVSDTKHATNLGSTDFYGKNEKKARQVYWKHISLRRLILNRAAEIKHCGCFRNNSLGLSTWGKCIRAHQHFTVQSVKPHSIGEMFSLNKLQYIPEALAHTVTHFTTLWSVCRARPPHLPILASQHLCSSDKSTACVITWVILCQASKAFFPHVFFFFLQNL